MSNKLPNRPGPERTYPRPSRISHTRQSAEYHVDSIAINLLRGAVFTAIMAAGYVIFQPSDKTESLPETLQPLGKKFQEVCHAEEGDVMLKNGAKGRSLQGIILERNALISERGLNLDCNWICSQVDNSTTPKVTSLTCEEK